MSDDDLRRTDLVNVLYGKLSIEQVAYLPSSAFFTFPEPMRMDAEYSKIFLSSNPIRDSLANTSSSVRTVAQQIDTAKSPQPRVSINYMMLVFVYILNFRQAHRYNLVRNRT